MLLGGVGKLRGQGLAFRGERHADHAPFADGSGYGQVFTGARLLGDVATNATRMQLGVPVGFELLRGMRFSMPDGRLHEIDDILGNDGTGAWTIGFAPWLRADYPAGAAVEFDRPVCRMRLAADDGATLSLRLNRFATPTIAFVEAF